MRKMCAKYPKIPKRVKAHKISQRETKIYSIYITIKQKTDLADKSIASSAIDTLLNL